MIKKTDMHVHSIFSGRPSEWVLKTIGTKESYTTPEEIFKKCIKKGMDYVTITDHNNIDGILKLVKKYPTNTFMGAELTSYFPEDNCKVHILVYDFSIKQFETMNSLRKNIYDLRNYILNNKIIYSVAHPTYSINKKLSLIHIEKLVLLFNNFEILNGGRNFYNNKIVENFLDNLSSEIITKLSVKHNIKPFGKNPHIKGYTGGSDDHSGLYIASSYTCANAKTKEDFIQQIYNKKSKVNGIHNNFHQLAFQIYKITYDYSKSKTSSASLFNSISKIIFEDKPLNFKEKLIFLKLKKKSKKRNDLIKKSLISIIDKNINNENKEIDKKIIDIYTSISNIVDQYFKVTCESIINNLDKLDLINIFQKLSSSLFGVLLTLPFLTTIQHLFQDRKLLEEISKKYIPNKNNKKKSIVWFTDTINDLNGVSITLKKIANLAIQKNENLTLISSLLDEEIDESLPENLLIINPIYSYRPKIYDNYLLKFPSFLTMIKKVYELNPDEIYVSTPGPVGLVGILISKLINVKSKIIFHTDFTKEAEEIMGDDRILSLLDLGLKTVYNSCDEILISTNEYINICAKKGFQKNKIKLFKRGLDLKEFKKIKYGKNYLKNKFNLNNGRILLFTGRISKDKNLLFLFELYKNISIQIPNINLIIVGDGPYKNELMELSKNYKNIYFTGRISQKEMPIIYSGADLLVFPSITDTFGMSVLEAQGCGLPAIVSDIGGPKEIVKHNLTGYILEANNHKIWEKTIINLLNNESNNKLESFSANALKMIHKNYNWDTIIDDYFKVENYNKKKVAIIK